LRFELHQNIPIAKKVSAVTHSKSGTFVTNRKLYFPGIGYACDIKLYLQRGLINRLQEA
jgi:hypothetical protein